MMTAKEILESIDQMISISTRTGVNPGPIHKVPLPEKPEERKPQRGVVYSFEIDILLEKEN